MKTNPGRNPLARFIVPGVPVAKARARFRRTALGFPYTPAKTVKAERDIKLLVASALGGKPISGPVKLVVEFRFPRGRQGLGETLVEIWQDSALDAHTQRPDLSNLVKTVEDGISTLLGDDAHISEIAARKRWVKGEGRGPGALGP